MGWDWFCSGLHALFVGMDNWVVHVLLIIGGSLFSVEVVW